MSLNKPKLAWDDQHQVWNDATGNVAPSWPYVPNQTRKPSVQPKSRQELVNEATRRVSQMPVSLRAPRPAGFDKCQHEAHCRMCLRHKRVRPLTQHHLVPLRWWKGVREPWRGVRNAPNNIIPLCRQCHDLVESPDRQVRVEARRMVRRAMTQAEIAFAIAARGKAWFDYQYP